jgi:hypothetical protein
VSSTQKACGAQRFREPTHKGGEASPKFCDALISSIND